MAKFMSWETDMMSKVVNRQDFGISLKVLIISFQVDIKISSDQGGCEKENSQWAIMEQKYRILTRKRKFGLIFRDKRVWDLKILSCK